MKQHSPRFLKIAEDAQDEVQRCAVSNVQEKLQSGETIKLIDVCEEREIAAGRLPNAILFSKGVTERDIEKTVPDHDTPIVPYCDGCCWSAMAADNLNRMGYTNVTSMNGGWTGWNEAGYATQK